MSRLLFYFTNLSNQQISNFATKQQLSNLAIQQLQQINISAT